jgi:hypothetical protein
MTSASRVLSRAFSPDELHEADTQMRLACFDVRARAPLRLKVLEECLTD